MVAYFISLLQVPSICWHGDYSHERLSLDEGKGSSILKTLNAVCCCSFPAVCAVRRSGGVRADSQRIVVAAKSIQSVTARVMSLYSFS